MLHWIGKFFRKIQCDNHDFEIVTRAREVSFYAGSCIEIEYYEDTIATCIHCEYKRTLNTVRSNRSVEHNELISVQRDPLEIYRHVKTKHKNKRKG